MTIIAVAYGLLILGGILVAAWFAKRWLNRQPPSPEEAGPLPEPTGELGWRALSDDSVTYGCGHAGPSRWVAMLFGLELAPKEEVLDKREKCPNCLTEKLFDGVIHCALCGLPIMPGDPVALYGGPKSSFRKEKGWVTMCDGDAVGCLRWDCCPSGGFFAGHWDGEKVISAFAGGNCAAAECLRTGKVVVGNIGPIGPKKPDDGEDN